jgi:hypothetical protein
MAFMNICERQPVGNCTLCKRLQGKHLVFKRRTDQEAGREIILPEETYPCAPWVRLNACGHYYHVHCLARSNPAKYTNIDVRNPDGTTEPIDIDEYDCLDCAGTQPNNSRFNPHIAEGTVQDDISDHTNSVRAFDIAEAWLSMYNARLLEMRQTVNIYTILDPLSYSLRSLKYALKIIRTRIAYYLSLQSDDGVIVPTRPVPDIFLFKQGRLLKDIPYLSFLKPIDIEYDMTRLSVKELNIRQLYGTLRITDSMKITRLNESVAELKRYMAGEPANLYSIELLELDPSIQTLVLEPTDRTDPLCVLNRHGKPKRFVVFDDFPIRENSGACSISGGTRKKRSRRPTRRSIIIS